MRCFPVAGLVVMVTVSLHLCRGLARLPRAPPGMSYGMQGQLEEWGYGMDTHSVRTEDGYILTVHRVLRRGPGPGKATPVLFLHGLGGSDELFFLRSPGDSLTLRLVDLGFDVWTINFRGNLHSRRHVSLPTTSNKFWDFSWHENGYYDVAATVDYILDSTKQPSLVCVGHSMGSTVMMVLLSDRPEYNRKVKATMHLAPAVYFQTLRGFFARLRKALLGDFQSILRSRVMMPHALEAWLDLPVMQLCLISSQTDLLEIWPLCLIGIEDSAGPLGSENNHTLLARMLSNWPRGLSSRQYLHYAQILSSDGEFRKYDFGPRYNLVLYGNRSAPLYNLTNVVSSNFIFYSDGDHIVHPKDVRRLASNIPGMAGLYKVPNQRFNHFDFLTDMNAFDLLYKTVIDRIMKYR